MGTLSVDNIEERSTGKGQNALSGQAKAHSYVENLGTTPSSSSEFNIALYTDHGVGRIGFNYSADMSGAAYAATANNANSTSASGLRSVELNTDAAQSASQVTLYGVYVNSTTNKTGVDNDISLVVMGDLA